MRNARRRLLARYLIAVRARRAGRGALPWCEIRPRAYGQWQDSAALQCRARCAVVPRRRRASPAPTPPRARVSTCRCRRLTGTGGYPAQRPARRTVQAVFVQPHDESITYLMI
ncbi:hypothetical protein B5X24_HaOG214481 [Helicoverpa armigera]|nr:hypothetical protein B5X24_HaOG214481 [Helicoverpa armigera]